MELRVCVGGGILGESESFTGMPTTAGQIEIDEAVTEPRKKEERPLSSGMHG